MLACLSVVLALLVSCQSKNRYVGVYKSDGQRQIVLELKENGYGTWRMGPDKAKNGMAEVPFVWYIKRGDLRINTKEGGVIVGKIGRDAIRITLPGLDELTFRKTG